MHEGEYLGMGLSHYLEHLVSGGTTTYRTEADYGEMGQQIGAITNAFTSYNMTAYHLVVNNRHFDTALQMLSEQVSSCVLDSFEVAREKEVILKEIVMRSTPPNAKVRQRQRELVYQISQNRFPVIGYVENFAEVTRDQLKDYYERRYVPNNMIFVVAGNIDPAQTMDKIELAFKDFQRKRLAPVEITAEPTKIYDQRFVEEFAIQLPKTTMTTIIPASNFKDVKALDFALEYLFNKRKSPIRYTLREEKKLVNYTYGYVSADNASLEGTANILFETSKAEDVAEVIQYIDKQLETMNEWCTDEMIAEAIQKAINRIKASMALDSPSANSEAMHIGINMLTNNSPTMDELELERLEQLQVKDVRRVIQEYLVPRNRVVFTAVPTGMKKKLESNNTTDVVITDINIEEENTIKLIHQYNNQANRVNVSIGLKNLNDSYFTKDEVVLSEFWSDLLLGGSKKYNPMDLDEWFEDHLVRVRQSVTEDGTTITFSCIKEDLDEMLNILSDAFANPTFDKKELQIHKKDFVSWLERKKSDAGSIHDEFRSKILYEGSKYALTNAEKINQTATISSKELRKFHKKNFASKELIFTITGNISKEEAMAFAKKTRKAIPSKFKHREEYPLPVKQLDNTFVNKYAFDQVNVDINYKAPAQESEDFLAFHFIFAYLNGSRGRLHQSTRGTNDLAYFAHGSYAFRKGDSFFRVTSQTSPKKKQELIDTILNEIELLKTQQIPQEKIITVADEFKAMMGSSITANSKHRVYTNNELRDIGYDFYSKSYEQMKSLTPEAIQNAAQKYFVKPTILISEPQDSAKVMVD
jgi:zinc protease